MIKTPEGKVLLFDEQGQQIARWPVDAKGMVATGGYSYTAPEGVKPQVPAAPPAAVEAPPPLAPGASTEASPGEPPKAERKKGKK